MIGNANLGYRLWRKQRIQVICAKRQRIAFITAVVVLNHTNWYRWLSFFRLIDFHSLQVIEEIIGIFNGDWFFKFLFD